MNLKHCRLWLLSGILGAGLLLPVCGTEMTAAAESPDAVSGATPEAESETTPVQSGTTPAESETTPAQSGTTPAQSGTAPAQSGTAPTKSATTFHRADNFLTQNEAGGLCYLENGIPKTGVFCLSPDFLAGDLDRNDAVDAADATVLLSAAAEAGATGSNAATVLTRNSSRFTDAQEAELFGDINEDGQLNADDAAQILVYSAGCGAGEALLPLGSHLYYADADGILQKGLITDADGAQRFADENYHVQTGFFELDGTVRYTDADGVLASGGWLELSGSRYRINTDSSLCTGWFDVNASRFYADADGKIAQYFAEIDGIRYFFDPEAGMQTGEFTFAGHRYLADPDGTLVTNRYVTGEDGAERYYDNAGVLQTGWFRDAETYRYADESGCILTGLQEIDGKTYYLEATPYSGFLRTEEGLRYFDEDGVMQTGWFTLTREQETLSYYGNADGFLAVGLQEMDGSTYLFNEDGEMQTGFAASEEGTRYFEESGAMHTGWITLPIEGTSDTMTYYFDENGFFVTGVQHIDDADYFFYENGVLGIGWQTIGEKLCYFDPFSFKMVHGWQTLSSGALCYFGEDGGMLYGWQTIDENRYYFDPVSGAMTTGWADIESGRYYFYETGILAVSTEIDGITIDENGLAMSQLLYTNKQRAAKLLNTYGTSLSGVFSAVRSTIRYKKIEGTRTLAQIESKGWLYFVDYAMTHSGGVCYYLAAKMDFLLQEAGFTCRVVHATHNTGDHYWNQILVNGVWTNYDCTSGLANRTWSQMVAYGNYVLLGYVYPKYQ